MSKVYTGDKPFEAHLKELESLYGKSNWKTHTERKLENETEETLTAENSKPAQSLEVRRLKLESGLAK
jgi:phosphoribosyl-dephospho-CoA transferase